MGSLFRKSSKPPALDNDLWALRDVSFDVKHGEIVGIIGRNGAGKSTLLKILSRITEPSIGRTEIYGRVGSLLEVGTGFHPELSGRENIYLNGAILGMTRHEINRKFDEIVAFAELEKFLDTPVKRYSSGMYVRLAFAVAAHLEPEVLLVDEVLAVGDVAFQRKCLGKMSEVATEGRTVLFVSHNMAAVQALCTRGVFLRYGNVWTDDGITETVSAYLRTLEDSASENIAERKERHGKGDVRLMKVLISTAGDNPSTTLASGHSARFAFHLSNVKPGLACGFTVYDHHGQPIADFNTVRPGPEDKKDPGLGTEITCELDELLLVPGRYRIDVDIRSNQSELEDHVEAAAFFDVMAGQLHGRPVAPTNKWGSAFMPHRWTLPD
jgi:lipopolysaccharide transport system ATP-binding protein